ncbi:MAG: M20/M25/M40 family metallo-hydrolase [Clostridiaceae bacterium]
MDKRIFDIANKYFDEITKTASEMIRIPSRSGHEKEMAEYTAFKMKELGYDEVVVDKVGNIIGRFKGTGGGQSLMLNCHLDVVDEGSHEKWKYPPFSGAIAEGAIWGRGASDTKGTFAIQLYTPYILKNEGMMTKGDIYVIGVVHEESSGFGSMTMVQEGFKVDNAIIGEATENDIAISCRGRVAINVIIDGKSCHASIPEEGVNPFDFLGKFLVELENYELGDDPVFGKSTISPTFISSSEKGTNIIPNTITLTLDYRSVPIDTNEFILEKLQRIVDKAMIPGISVGLEIIKIPVKCYTGFEGEGYQGEPAFAISKNHELVVTSKNILEKTLGRKVQIKPWAFATDSGHFMNAGVSVIGFSPAEIKKCHTVEDNIRLDMLKEGIVGYIALSYEIANKSK